MIKLNVLVVVLNIIWILYIHCGAGESIQSGTILVLGLSGAGISSTVEILLKVPHHKSRDVFPTVLEYSWRVPASHETDTFIRFVDCPGVVNGKSQDEDAKSLATIKEYIQSPSGLNGSYPSIVIIVSRFDDTRVDNINSRFVKMIRTVELLRSYFSEENSPSNIIFHMTHLMSRTKSEQRRPNNTIQSFKEVIKKFSTFPEPITATIGENLPEYLNELPQRNSYALLPNKELYPKNLIDKMLEITWQRLDRIGYEVIREAFRNPNRTSTPNVKIFSIDEEEYAKDNYFSTELKKTHLGIDISSEVYQELQNAHKSLDESLTGRYPTVLDQMITTFQSLGITTKAQLPKTPIGIAELYQKLPFNVLTLALMQEAFDVQQQEFTQPIFVGYGYNVLTDEVLPSTPFVLENLSPTALGYALPDVLSYQQNEQTESSIFKLLPSYNYYKQVRLNSLGVGKATNLTIFSGKIRAGYNVHPENEDEFEGITAVKEIRGFKLELIQSSELNSRFIRDVNSLTPFIQTERKSVAQWKNFFKKYGTSIVSEAYGGGFMEGKVIGDYIEDNLENPNILEEFKNVLLEFSNSSARGAPWEDMDITFEFRGGALLQSLQQEQIYYLAESQREIMLNNWKSSLQSNPIILSNKLKLTPISTIAASINETIAQEIQKTSELFLQGNLVYKRQQSRRPLFPTPPVPTSSTTQRVSPSPGPTTTPCPSMTTKTGDYKENTIGQGYHITKDLILPKSPIAMGVRTSDGRNIFSVLSLTPCTAYTLSTVTSYQEYALLRLLKVMPTLQNYLTTDFQFKGSLRPGYTLVPSDSSSFHGPYSVLAEKRYFHFKMEPDRSKWILDSDYINDVNQLPHLTSNDGNCSVVGKWLDFFDKYGTHIVTEGYAGIVYETSVAGMSLSQLRNDYTTDTCQQIHPHDRKTVLRPSTAVESLRLLPMGNLINLVRKDMYFEGNIVINRLVSNQLLRRC